MLNNQTIFSLCLFFSQYKKQLLYLNSNTQPKTHLYCQNGPLRHVLTNVNVNNSICCPKYKAEGQGHSEMLFFQVFIHANSPTSIQTLPGLVCKPIAQCLFQGICCCTRTASLLCITWNRLLLTMRQPSDSAPETPGSTSFWAPFWRSSTTPQRSMASRGRFML